MKMLLLFCILQLSITINAELVEVNVQNINRRVAEQPISIATTDSNWQIKPNDTMYCRPELQKCYIVLMQKQSWLDAEKQCNAIEHKNAHLTSIQSHLENMHVFGFANLSDDYWIGGSYDNQSLFAWTDNTSYQYREWTPNIHINESVADMCVAVAAGFDRLRTMWYNMSCKDEKFAVCEFDADENVTTNEFLKCDDGWIYYAFTNACYMHNATSGVTWDNAQHICEQNNANLTSIHSAEENDFVSGLAFDSNLVHNPNNDIPDMTWIGSHSLTNYTHRFSWIDGTPFDYFKWRDGEPNYDGECVEILTQSPECYNRTWNDVDCATPMRSFVCKRSLITTSTTTSSTPLSNVTNSTTTSTTTIKTTKATTEMTTTATGTARATTKTTATTTSATTTLATTIKTSKATTDTATTTATTKTSTTTTSATTTLATTIKTTKATTDTATTTATTKTSTTTISATTTFATTTEMTKATTEMTTTTATNTTAIMTASTISTLTTATSATDKTSMTTTTAMTKISSTETEQYRSTNEDDTSIATTTHTKSSVSFKENYWSFRAIMAGVWSVLILSDYVR